LNLKAENELLPGIGVYVSRMSVDGGPFVESITNVGVRPTFDDGELTIETFILNGQVPPAATRARLEFVKRLRNERRFESVEALRRQILLDVGRAQRFFQFLKAFKHAGN
jgi:riboflavin kinase/FMN adenylyltransferase